MKKVLVGCLAAVVLVTGIGGVLGYVFIVRPARDYLGAFTQLAEIGELDRQVRNTSAYQPPASGELTPEMVDRFATVQRTMKSRLGTRFEELETKYEDLGQQMDQDGRDMRLREVLGVYRDMLGLLVEAKRAQVDGLNEAEFSVQEYVWVREQVYHAAGLTLLGLDLNQLQAALEEGDDSGAVRAQAALDVPERNRELVEPYADDLEDWIAFGFFGL